MHFHINQIFEKFRGGLSTALCIISFARVGLRLKTALACAMMQTAVLSLKREGPLHRVFSQWYKIQCGGIFSNGRSKTPR